MDFEAARPIVTSLVRGIFKGRTIAALILLVLLIGLGTLQYRWIGEISHAEARRRQTQLQQAAQRLASDLQFEAASELVRLKPLPAAARGQISPAPAWPLEENWLDQRWRRWRRRHAQGSLLADIAVMRHDPQGRLIVYGWDAARQRLQRQPEHDFRKLPPAWRQATMLVQPLLHFKLLRPPPPRFRAPGFPLQWRAGSSASGQRTVVRRGFPVGPPALLVVRLQPDYLRRILPQLLERELGQDWQRNYRVGLYGLGPRRLSFFQTHPAPQPGMATVRQILIGWRRPMFRLLARRQRQRERNVQFFVKLRAASHSWMMADGPGGIWSLWLEPQPNRVDALVISGRWRNLALSFGILAVLGASLLLLALESRRARQLAGRQMDFVAGITHELRSPLAVMAAAGDNLAEGVVQTQDAVRQHGEAIRRHARRLSQMIEQILEFAALKSGKRAYHVEPLLLTELMDEVAAQSRGSLAEAGATLATRCAPSLPPIMADRAALSQVLHNLLGNAIKFGGRGVQIELTAAPDSEPQWARLIVADNGPGIPAAELKHVFEPFFRGAQARARQIRGSGLGLSLVRQAVIAMGGRVWVESSPGAGSRFCLQLPLTSALDAASIRMAPATPAMGSKL